MIHILEVLTALGLAAAGGLRTSLALMILAIAANAGYSENNALTQLITTPLGITVLGVWCVFELVATKTALGQRLVQALQFFIAPVTGAMIASAFSGEIGMVPQILVGFAGAALAATLQAVYMGYFFRRGRAEAPVQLLQEGLCGILVLLALATPVIAGFAVFGLLWIVLQQSYSWRKHFNRPGTGVALVRNSYSQS
ncbi:MAG: DUF4126 domain-containing protein [Anaerolineae bacterium]|nr:DUF4126 domain-containing protein [Gloeobacterales cyanobacterium ES-bin-313]